MAVPRVVYIFAMIPHRVMIYEASDMASWHCAMHGAARTDGKLQGHLGAAAMAIAMSMFT